MRLFWGKKRIGAAAAELVNLHSTFFCPLLTFACNPQGDLRRTSATVSAATCLYPPQPERYRSSDWSSTTILQGTLRETWCLRRSSRSRWLDSCPVAFCDRAVRRPTGPFQGQDRSHRSHYNPCRQLKTETAQGSGTPERTREEERLWRRRERRPRRRRCSSISTSLKSRTRRPVASPNRSAKWNPSSPSW